MTAAARIDTPAQPLSLDELETSIQSAKKALLALGLTQAQINSCKVEGAAYPVVRIKAKKAKAA